MAPLPVPHTGPAPDHTFSTMRGCNQCISRPAKPQQGGVFCSLWRCASYNVACVRSCECGARGDTALRGDCPPRSWRRSATGRPQRVAPSFGLSELSICSMVHLVTMHCAADAPACMPVARQEQGSRGWLGRPPAVLACCLACQGCCQQRVITRPACHAPPTFTCRRCPQQGQLQEWLSAVLRPPPASRRANGWTCRLGEACTSLQCAAAMVQRHPTLPLLIMRQARVGCGQRAGAASNHVPSPRHARRPRHVLRAQRHFQQRGLLQLACLREQGGAGQPAA